MDRLINFFKNKFNMTLVIMQVIAIICYLLSYLVGILSVGFFIMEGAFFVAWGIKYIVVARHAREQVEIYNELPMDNKRRERAVRGETWGSRNSMVVGILLIILGGVLIFSVLSRMF